MVYERIALLLRHFLEERAIITSQDLLLARSGAKSFLLKPTKPAAGLPVVNTVRLDINSGGTHS
jgi:hypothetical protein